MKLEEGLDNGLDCTYEETTCGQYVEELKDICSELSCVPSLTCICQACSFSSNRQCPLCDLGCQIATALPHLDALGLMQGSTP